MKNFTLSQENLQMLKSMAFQPFTKDDWMCWAGCEDIKLESGDFVSPMVYYSEDFTFIFDGSGFYVNLNPDYDTLSYDKVYNLDLLSVFADYYCDIVEIDCGYLIPNTEFTNEKIAKIFPYLFHVIDNELPF